MYISSTDRERAVAALVQWLPPPKLRQLIPVSLRRLVSGVEGRGALSGAQELAEFLVDLYGTDLLAQSEVREQLCLARDRETLLALAEAAGVEASGSRRTVARRIAQRKWYAGRHWARYFAASFGFPLAFAGEIPSPPDPPFEDVEALAPLPELWDYQQRLCKQVLEVLQAPPGRNRGIVSLPTGAGKTRTVVEALVQALVEGRLHRPSILWIAHSEELCEQAFHTFRKVWLYRGRPGNPLRLYRVWGGRDLPPVGDGGVLIASIQKLYEATRHHDQELDDWASALGAVVIDEAHHAIADSYTTVLEKLGLRSGRRETSSIPLIGLTATPYRSASQTPSLARRFHSNLLVPFPPDVNPVEELQRRGILSRLVHEVVETDADVSMTEAEVEHLKIFADFSESFIKRLGRDATRNRAILARIASLDRSWPVLFFACSTEHAHGMAVLLRRHGIRAAAVTSETSRSVRRSIVEDFRKGEIQVLCNYGIFTTGFDAPNVRVVVVARPTTSPVLYEQMIGRGMRGPKNGGTEECLIIDLSDNLDRFGYPMAYQRFSDYWKHNRTIRARQLAGSESAR